MGIALKKSNAYKLPGKMEEEGWVTHHQEREGNHLPRRVYAITPEGEAAFQLSVQRLLHRREEESSLEQAGEDTEHQDHAQSFLTRSRE